MTASLVFWTLLGVLGCDPDPQRSGTLVGNPGKASARLAPDVGLEVLEAEATWTLDWIGCEGELATSPNDAFVNLVENSPETAPAGQWCAVELTMPEPLRFVAIFLEQTEVVGAIELAGPWRLNVPAPLVVDETNLVLELGAPDWFSTTLQPDGDRLEFGADGEAALRLADALTSGASLLIDAGEDGVDTIERAAPVAAVRFGPYEPRSVPGTDGCQVAPSFATGWVLFAVVPLLRRRKSHAP